MVICRVVGSRYTLENGIGKQRQLGRQRCARWQSFIGWREIPPFCWRQTGKKIFRGQRSIRRFRRERRGSCAELTARRGEPGWASTSSGCWRRSPIAPRRCLSNELRSRGLLCRDLLDRRNARDAVDYAVKELSTGAYAGANYLCARRKVRGRSLRRQPRRGRRTDPRLAHPDQRQPRRLPRRAARIRPPHVDLHTLDSAVTFLAVASRAFPSRTPKAAAAWP